MFHFEFPQNPRPCRIPGPRATFKSQIPTPRNVFELIPGACPGGMYPVGIDCDIRESEKALELVEPRVPKDLISRAPLKLHLPNRSKHIEAKIAEINKKIRRAKNRRNKEHPNR